MYLSGLCYLNWDVTVEGALGLEDRVAWLLVQEQNLRK